MTQIAAALLLAVFAPNYGDKFMAWALDGDPVRWQYILEGFALLPVFYLIGSLCKNRLVWAICIWGMFEATLKGVCGSFRLFDKVFAPGGYVCTNGEVLSLLGVWAAVLLAIGVYHAARTSRPV